MELEELRMLQERKDELTRTLESAVSSEGPDDERDDTMMDKSKLTGLRKSTKMRGGAKANKEMLEKLEKRIDECVTKEENMRIIDDLQRATTSVTVFKQ